MAETLSLLTRQGNKMSKLDTSWFKPENYSSLPELSLLDWYKEIIYRTSIKNALPWILGLDSKVVAQFAKLLEVIKEEGLVLRKRKPLYLNGLSYPYLRDSNLYPADTHSVKAIPASLLKFVVDNGLLSSFDKSYEAVSKGKATDEQFKDSYGSFDDMQRRAGADVSHAHITVNLDATDTQIETDFKEWLSSYRLSNESKTPKNDVNQATINKWVRSGVLQYIDLKLVADMEQKKITAKQLAVLIFPNEFDEDTTRRISETTKKHAEEILSGSFMNAFEHQVFTLDDGIEY